MAEDDVPELDDERGPERTCIVTSKKSGPDQMIRFVIGPDTTVYPDIRARLPGRGAWVDGLAMTVDLAIKRKAFVRAFKRECVVDPRLCQQLDGLLEQDALQSLAFANKAGLLVCGTAKVESALAGGSVRALIHASNGSQDGTRKLDSVARRAAHGGSGAAARIEFFSSDQLDLAIGRSNVIHAALLDGGVSAAFLARAGRLGRFRGTGMRQEDQALDEPGSSDFDKTSG